MSAYVIGDQVEVALLIPAQLGGGVYWLPGVVVRVMKRTLMVRIDAGVLTVSIALVRKAAA